jgi:site-specific recombinase XerD
VACETTTDGEPRHFVCLGGQASTDAMTSFASFLLHAVNRVRAFNLVSQPLSRTFLVPGLGGALYLRNWTRRVWRPAADAAGMDAVPYDGRHTFASLLIHEGRALPYVSAALGHSSYRMTLDRYTHVFDEARLSAATPMVQAIREARDQLARAGVRSVCETENVRVLRSRLRGARSG